MFEMQFCYFAKNDGLPLFIQRGAHENYMFPHQHTDFYELCLITSGTAEHITGNRRMQVHKGELFVIPPKYGHAFENAKGLRLFNLMFKPEALRNAPEAVRTGGLIGNDNKNGFKSRMTLSPEDFTKISLLLSDMTDEYNLCRPGRKELLECCFSGLMIYASRLYEQPVKKREISGITAAAAYLEEHYMEEQPLKQAAVLSNYSQRHFSRLFSEVYSVSPQDYLFNVRMRHASELLRTTGLSVAEAAQKCGFSDSGYFTRAFKKKFGLLPSHYRAGKI